MSRIGKQPVVIPEKVKVSLNGSEILVEGPKGRLEKQFAPVVTIEEENGQIIVRAANTTRFSNTMTGTARSIIDGMVEGVTKGFSKELEIQGVGFRAALNGKILDLSLGYSHPINYPIPEGITVTVTDNTKLKVEGLDKQMVGAVTADIRRFYPPEPYKGKGIRIVGERVRRKEGKTVA
jgi:large subunit ribosomal protein L6